MKKLPLLSLATLILVFLGGFFTFAGQASAQAYCGDSLRLDPIRCDVAGTGVDVSCYKVQLSGPQYVASCTGNPNNCQTNFNVSGSVNGCSGPFWEAGSGDYICLPTSAKAACWVNPGDPAPPPPPSNDTCGKACSSSSECGGLTCAPAGVCWANSCDTGNPAPNHRVRVKVLDCNNNPKSGVPVKGWDNSYTTNNNGIAYVSKGTACQDDQRSTPIVVGYDANTSHSTYYSRVDSPSFERGSCAEINCGYKGTPITSNPYREAYHIDMQGETKDSFTYKFCATSDSGANTGFDFKQISGCARRPDAKISNVSNLKYGETLTWTVEASDADGNLASTGIYYDRGEPAIGAGDWKPLKWVGSQNASALTYKHSDNNVLTSWVCNAGNQGTWTLTTNAEDKTGLECSGDPIGSATRCASGLS